MIDPFDQWIVFQEQAIDVQKKQLEMMRQGLKAAGDIADAQQAIGDAATAHVSLWKSWFALWGVK